MVSAIEPRQNAWWLRITPQLYSHLRCLAEFEHQQAIQCFGRVHRANQLVPPSLFVSPLAKHLQTYRPEGRATLDRQVPPKFIMLCTDLGGEVRFTSAIARLWEPLGS